MIHGCVDAFFFACSRVVTRVLLRFIRHLGDVEVQLSHFGVGASAMRAIADAMRLNPPLKALDLTDNWLFGEGGLEVARCASFLLMPPGSSARAYGLPVPL